MTIEQSKQKHYFRTLDLIYIAIFAGIGIAIKPLTASISGFLKTIIPLPGGSILGIIYSFILFTGAGLVKKPGAASLIGIIQAILVMIISFGGHGGLSLITYTVPCFMADVIIIIFRRLVNLPSYILSGGMFNSVGAALIIIIFQRATVNATVILIGCSIAFIMGALGGIMANRTVRIIEKVL